MTSYLVNRTLSLVFSYETNFFLLHFPLRHPMTKLWLHTSKRKYCIYQLSFILRQFAPTSRSLTSLLWHLGGPFIFYNSHLFLSSFHTLTIIFWNVHFLTINSLSVFIRLIPLFPRHIIAQLWRHIGNCFTCFIAQLWRHIGESYIF